MRAASSSISFAGKPSPEHPNADRRKSRVDLVWVYAMIVKADLAIAGWPEIHQRSSMQAMPSQISTSALRFDEHGNDIGIHSP